ncbi:MAG TPA: tetratricopeptide repeat protein [Candidatus Kapabacteria bacterium]|nr:tetratricopeptide repeat protein [Candidatus Kapabacteria bacterium]
MSEQSPISPLFPVIADELLADGNILEAVELCEQGVVAFPRYSTGYLIAAKAYMHAKRFADAIAMCETGLAYTPSSNALIKMREMITAEEAKHAQRIAEHPAEAPEALENTEEDETALGKLARELEGAKIPAIDQSAPLPPLLKEEIAQPATGTLVSSTLAGIYEKQGAYDDAIQAYTALAAQTPAMREEYNKKIEALKEKKNASKNSKK